MKVGIISVHSASLAGHGLAREIDLSPVFPGARQIEFGTDRWRATKRGKDVTALQYLTSVGTSDSRWALRVLGHLMPPQLTREDTPFPKRYRDRLRKKSNLAKRFNQIATLTFRTKFIFRFS